MFIQEEWYQLLHNSHSTHLSPFLPFFKHFWHKSLTFTSFGINKVKTFLFLTLLDVSCISFVIEGWIGAVLLTSLFSGVGSASSLFVRDWLSSQSGVWSTSSFRGDRQSSVFCVDRCALFCLCGGEFSLLLLVDKIWCATFSLWGDDIS